MRPILLLLAHQLFDEDIEKAIKPSLAIEVFTISPCCTMISWTKHLSEGQSNGSTKWNENVAILSGDAMLIQSYQYLCDLPSSK